MRLFLPILNQIQRSRLDYHWICQASKLHSIKQHVIMVHIYLYEYSSGLFWISTVLINSVHFAYVSENDVICVVASLKLRFRCFEWSVNTLTMNENQICSKALKRMDGMPNDYHAIAKQYNIASRLTMKTINENHNWK